MSTAMTMQTASSKCPCGCSGSKTGSPCRCGCADCSSCQGEQFVRPRFFAGQLLTEDDLQTLTDYVAGKNRLHNRFLFGSGVVCGLQVKRDPCACGKLIVNPGFAIDCCGNDIIVSCPQTLDINKMIRELKTKLRGGADCGDPCAGTSTATGSNANEASLTASGAPSPNGGIMQSADAPRTYCLYVDYCETPTDPVAPYATGGSCGSPNCEATRISEGFRFELRCPSKEDCDCSICKAFEACPGPESQQAIRANGILLREFSSSAITAVSAIRKQIAPKLSLGSVREALAVLGKVAIAQEPPERELKAFAFKIRNAMIAISPALFADAHRDDTALQEWIEKVSAAIGTLETHRARLNEPLWKSYADALTEVFRDFEETWKERQRAAEIPVELQLLAHGSIVTPSHLKECFVAARNLNLWLLEREVQAGSLPPARSSKSQLLLSSMVIGPVLSLSEVDSIARETDQVLRAAQQHMKECVCNALLPPCCTCTDTSVHIACITVKDCCVTEICNLDRKFVLSPTALRYWVPELHELGESIEAFCCPRRCEGDENSLDLQLLSGEDDPSLFQLMGRSPALGEVVIASLLRGCRPVKGRNADRQLRRQGGGAVAMAFSRLTSSGSSFSIDNSIEKNTIADLEERLNSALADLEKQRTDLTKLAGRLQRMERRSRAGSGGSNI